MTETLQKKPNHLIQEKSPYLLQHAYNPVEWYPWGDEAIARARAENKPILVSIGYSTCHWCHVMEKESFSNPAVAAVMNEHLINIKIDREERPDVDKIYMSAVTAMIGSGGWPLNVFLTPDLRPFFGGTYFPPEDRFGTTGWSNLVKRIHEVWTNTESREKMLASAADLTAYLRETLGGVTQKAEGSEAGKAPEALSAAITESTAKAILDVYDPHLGGFGSAPKFPMPVYHNFLQATQTGANLEASHHSLRAMAKGGIFDHLGGGFHRYSTDGRWHVPHFEKMLYDNAQLAFNYLNAFVLTREPVFERVARQTLDYLLRDMTHPQGGFYSAEDADSLPPELAGKVIDDTHEHRTEGAFYVWEAKEIAEIAGAEAGKIFSYHYGVADMGNVREDPHGELIGKNVLFEARTAAETAAQFSKNESEIEKILADARAKLFQKRASRPRPHLDDKIIASWNGLAISAFARAYQVLEDERYLAAAKKAGDFLWNEMVDLPNGQLYRRWRDGERKIKGIADDYAFAAQGYLDLYEADFNEQDLRRAVQLCQDLNERFFDPIDGGYYMTEPSHDPNLLIRTKEDYDNVEPSASSVACGTLLRLSEMTGRGDFVDAAEKTFHHFAPTLNNHPRAMPQLAMALDFRMKNSCQIILMGDKGATDTQAMLRAIRALPVFSKTVLLIDNSKFQQELARTLPYLAGFKREGNRATAYVCVNQACRLPTTDPQALAQAIGAQSNGAAGAAANAIPEARKLR